MSSQKGRSVEESLPFRKAAFLGSVPTGLIDCYTFKDAEEVTLHDCPSELVNKCPNFHCAPVCVLGLLFDTFDTYEHIYFIQSQFFNYLLFI